MDTGDGEGSNAAGAAHGSVRKNIAIKLKQPTKDKAAAKEKKSRGKASKRERQQTGELDLGLHDDINSDKPIQQFQPISISGPQEPTHKALKLKWDYKQCERLYYSIMKIMVEFIPAWSVNSFNPNYGLERRTHSVNLLGDKVVDPLIHSCEKCALPILIYGRMIPCKHIFCFSCAKQTDKNCPRCNAAVTRIEQSALGTVFVCTFGGTKHGVSGCHRTYLSQRDLQSHMAHRHKQESSSTRPHPEHNITVNQSVQLQHQQLPVNQLQQSHVAHRHKQDSSSTRPRPEHNITVNQSVQLQHQQLPVNQLQQVMMTAGQHPAHLKPVVTPQSLQQLQQQQLQQQQQHGLPFHPSQPLTHLSQPPPADLHLQMHSLQQPQGLIQQPDGSFIQIRGVAQTLPQGFVGQVHQSGVPAQQGLPPQPGLQQGLISPQSLQGLQHQGIRLQQVGGPQGMPQGLPHTMLGPTSNPHPAPTTHPGGIQFQGMNMVAGGPRGVPMVVQQSGPQQPPGSSGHMMPVQLQQGEGYRAPGGPDMSQGQPIFVSQSGALPQASPAFQQQRFTASGSNVSYGGQLHNIGGPFVAQAGPPRTIGPPGHLGQQQPPVGINPMGGGGQFNERMGLPPQHWGPRDQQHRPTGPPPAGAQGMRPPQFFQ